MPMQLHVKYYQTVKFRPQFKTQYNCIQFPACILYYWPGDDPLRSKHIDKLNIKILLVVLMAIYFSCYI